MTDHTYTSIADIEHCRPLWESGTLVSTLTHNCNKHLLYQLDDSYVEVTWHTHFNVILKVSRFSDGEALDLHLNKISLKELLA